MKIQLIVRLRPESDLAAGHYDLEWCWGNREGQPDGETERGSLSALASWWQACSQDEQELPVIVLIPGQFASCHQVALNENQRKHWQQALPYLLEEQLASDLERLHLVSYAGSAHEYAYAGCIARNQMEQLLASFSEAGLDPQKVIPDVQFFPGAQDVISIWLESDMALVAMPNSFGQLLDSEALSVIVPGLLADEELPDEQLLEEGEELSDDNVVTGVVIYHASSNADMVTTIKDLVGGDVPVEGRCREQESLLADILPKLEDQTKKRQLLDFRTGTYKCTRRASKRWRQWRPVAIVAGVWLGLELLFNIGSGFYFQNRADVLRDENFATYKELRPDDRRVVDVRHNLTKFLRDANNQGSQAVFLDMLKTLSNVSDGETGKAITPRNMDFNDANGRLSLDVQAGSFETLNRYVDELKAAGLNAKMETGNQDAQGVSARLTVRSA